MSLRHRLLSALVCASAVGSFAGPAAAFGPIPKPKIKIDVPKLPSGVEDNDRKQMAEVNRLAQEGLRQVPGNFQGDFAKRQADMAEAKVFYEDCAARMKTVVNPSINEGAQRYWGEFELAYEQGLLQLDITARWDPIRTLHAQQTPVVDADLDALDAAVAAFAKGHHKDYAGTLKGWQDAAKKMRAENARLLERNAAKAAADAAKLDLDQRNGVLARAEAAIAAMAATAKEDKAPIAPAVWQELEAALKEADAYSPKIRTSFEDAAWDYRVYDAWYDADAPAAVAKAMSGGTVQASGKLTTRQGKVRVKVPAGQCYALVTRFATRTGNERVKDVSPVIGKNAGELLAMYGGSQDWSRFRGACPIKDAEIAYDFDLEVPGSKVDLQWVLVAWPRASFPVQVAARAEVWGPVPCSGPITESMFKNAIPGLFVWSKKGTPILIKGINQGNFMGRTVENNDTQIDIDTATLAWPATKNLPSTEYHQSCSGYDDSEDPLVDKMSKCHRAIDKQFNPKYTAAARRRDTALTIGAHNAAVREIDALNVAEAKARDQKCGALERQVERAMSEAITRLNDWFLAPESQQATAGHPDVPAYLRDVYEGRRKFTK